MRRWLTLSLGTLLLTAVPVFSAPAHVAVFNFEMTTGPAQWRWLEKGLADRTITDFTRSRRLTVVARDEMQLLARQFRWTPEMAMTDGAKLEQIRQQLKCDYLVTGVYAAAEERIAITAQIVKVDTRQEVFRTELSGPLTEVLDVQKRVSADLLSWLTGVRAETILPGLPVWTTSVPATQALYEGLHLYDEGRYGEAWLKFRQASSADPTYLEARYWVARMYYFMDRYEHARSAYERFVYEGAGHPRVGDAVKEYLHTYEKLGSSAEQLLALYAEFIGRYPEVKVSNEMDVNVPVTVRAWLRTRSAQLLGELGRHKEATELAAQAMAEVQEQVGWWASTGWAFDVAFSNATLYNQKTGKVHMPEGLLGRHRVWEDGNVIRFRPGMREALYRRIRRMHLNSTRLHDGRMWYDHTTTSFFLLAPDGYVFTKLRVLPLVDGDDGKIGCWLGREAWNDAGGAPDRPIAQAVEEGFAFDSVPRSGIFVLNFTINPNDRYRDPKVAFLGVRVQAEMEPVGPFGLVEVSSLSTHDAVVLIDGQRQRTWGGTVGLVPPGSHRLTLQATRQFYPQFKREAIINVQAGQTLRLQSDIPWKHDSLWAQWSTGTNIGLDYPDLTPCLQTARDRPTIQADGHAVRVFWSYRGDLWQAVSTDGRSFARPAKLPMPVSSGWLERDPLCLRDESGRFVLVFRSDREARHQLRLYAAWSRDGLNWSRPAMVVDRAVDQYDLMQDSRGRFILADATGRTLTVLRSADGYQWDALAAWPLAGAPSAVRVLERADGTYELVSVQADERATSGTFWSADLVVYDQRSADGAAWTKPAEVGRFPVRDDLSLSAMHVDGRTILACSRRHTLLGSHEMSWLFRESGQGGWQSSGELSGVAGPYAHMAHHPRWGYLYAWHQPRAFLYPMNEPGPYFIRGDSVEPLFGRHQADESPLP